MIAHQAALHAHHVQVAPCEMRDEFQCVARRSRPVEPLTDQMNEIAGRYQRNAPRTVGEIHRIHQAAGGQPGDEFHLVVEDLFIRPARWQRLDADHKPAVLEFAREPAIEAFFRVAGGRQGGC